MGGSIAKQKRDLQLLNAVKGLCSLYPCLRNVPRTSSTDISPCQNLESIGGAVVCVGNREVLSPLLLRLFSFPFCFYRCLPGIWPHCWSRGKFVIGPCKADH